MSVSDNDKIQPATTPLPSCSHANLMTPCLQQLTNRLLKKKVRFETYLYAYRSKDMKQTAEYNKVP